jgi:hypothetical protein
MINNLELATINNKVEEYYNLIFKLIKQIVTEKSEFVIVYNNKPYSYKIFIKDGKPIIFTHNVELSKLDLEYLIKEIILTKYPIILRFTNYTGKYYMDKVEYYEIWGITIYIDENNNITYKYMDVNKLQVHYREIMKNPKVALIKLEQLIYRDNINTLMEIFSN